MKTRFGRCVSNFSQILHLGSLHCFLTVDLVNMYMVVCVMGLLLSWGVWESTYTILLHCCY
jgi:hypothetical protein